GSTAALAVLPCGTANVWAREAFVPRDPQRALALVANGRRARIDLGEATIGDGVPRRFLLMCGAGLDAAVVAAVEARPRLKRALGRLSFLAAGAPVLAGAQANAVSLTHDRGHIERSLLLAVAGNTRLYGGMVQLTDGARIDDGQLDVVTFSANDSPALLRALRYAALGATALRGGLATRSAPGVDYLRTRQLSITPERALAIHADGEAIGIARADAPLHLRALPQALTVVIGRQPNSLLGER
ncbi:MAG: diacylglycerol kinase family protein, partial [Chloroflexi bacterium]|nr:diacylglycerol kinase family protein [Chloroflexota bacterium]